MVRLTVIVYKCDHCGKRKKMDNEIQTPNGWTELSSSHGPYGHYCRSCRWEAQRVSISLGLRIWPEKLK
jgi:hypothetical protein